MYLKCSLKILCSKEFRDFQRHSVEEQSLDLSWDLIKDREVVQLDLPVEQFLYSL